jgi:hypothetical protein
MQSSQTSKTPRVLNKHKDNIPADAIYVGRGSKWGNPFRMLGNSVEMRHAVCDSFEKLILTSLDVTELRGKDLVCFCAPFRCHADALLRKANA